MRLQGITVLISHWSFFGASWSLTSPTPGTPLQPRSDVFNQGLDYYASSFFKDVQESSIFNDSKTFPDMIPRVPVKRILDAYQTQKDDPEFVLKAFIDQYYDLPDVVAVDDGKARADETLKTYIQRMWPLLIRSFHEEKGSIIPLPKEAIVPGGRFREAYYWDSLFPFLVLLEDPKMQPVAKGLLENVAYLARHYGYVPNGNRDYYLGRSQPPVMAMMINALLDKYPEEAVKYVDALEAEFSFWMREDKLEDDQYPKGRAVEGTDGTKQYTVNIYDAAYGDLPRPEAWKEDIAAKANDQEKRKLPYRDIKASCESGWDFTSRFALHCNPMACLHTTDFAPVDLNVLLQHAARVLSKIYKALKDEEKSDKYRAIAEMKKKIINDYFWNETEGVFMDRLWRTGEFSEILTPASIFPLAFNLTTPDRAEKSLKKVTENLLKKGGLATTKRKTGQQWDAPYGWAPLQYFYIVAALNYGFVKEAKEVAERWIAMIEHNFKEHGRIFEKYNVETGEFTVEGGQYTTQAGFAFTNAVTYDIIEMLDVLGSDSRYSSLITLD